jgi:hypothetical protein
MTTVVLESEFDDFLKANCARFTETIGRYTARMPKRDREDFIKLAYKKGLEAREEIGKVNNIRWWEDVCRATAKTRATWATVTTTGIEKTRSSRLGR